LFDQARFELQHGPSDKRGQHSEPWTALRDEEKDENVEKSSKADSEETQ
jgi:hypothetical protein